MNRFCITLLVTALSCSFATAVQASKGRIGIAFPTQNEPAWYAAGPALEKELRSRGYETVLYYGGDNDIPIQQAQIPRMMNEDHVNAMIIAPIDANSLLEQMEPVSKAGIPVLSFDRLIMYTESVKYYVGFDNVNVGKLQGEAMVRALKLDERDADNPAYIELLSGDHKDRSAEKAFNGFLSVILPYIDDGRVVVPSDQFFFAMCTVEQGNDQNAMKRMDSLIADKGYGPKGARLDAVYCATDSVADGVLMSLKNAGYTVENMPYLTGRDATESAIKGILTGERGSTIYRDPNVLNDSAVKIIDAMLNNQEPEVNDTTSYNNGYADMKSLLSEPVLLDKSNVRKYFPDVEI